MFVANFFSSYIYGAVVTFLEGWENTEGPGGLEHLSLHSSGSIVFKATGKVEIGVAEDLP